MRWLGSGFWWRGFWWRGFHFWSVYGCRVFLGSCTTVPIWM